MIDLVVVTQGWDVVKCPDDVVNEAARLIIITLRKHSMDGNRLALEKCIDRLMATPGSLENALEEGQLAVEAAIALCNVGNYERAEETLVFAAKQTQCDGPRHGFVKLMQGFVSYKLGKAEIAVEELGASYHELKHWSECHSALDQRMRRDLNDLVTKIPKFQAEIITELPE